MKKQKAKKLAKGFTLIELLIVIAIIGILAGVVMVNSKSAVDKAKKSSVISTASSILPQLVSCQDDGGFADTSAPNSGDNLCCLTSATHCTGTNYVSGYSTATWPDISKTNWQYSGSPTGAIATGDYQYTLTRIGGSGTGNDLITCSLSTNTCN